MQKNIMQTDFFKWNKAFETGITKIDIQHKVIVKILNELYDIIIGNEQEEKINEIIHELIQYTKYHFSEEEKLFEKYNYIEKVEHEKEHENFVEEIKTVVSQMNTDKGMVAIELLNFLKDWLTEHIMVTDQKYVKFFKENGL